jgi:hypothetical protein
MDVVVLVVTEIVTIWLTVDVYATDESTVVAAVAEIVTVLYVVGVGMVV